MIALRHLLSTCCLLLIAWSCQAQLLWEKTWGGPYDDGCEVRNTADGGMIAMGTFGGNDSWLMRLDSHGDTLWTRHITQPYDLCAVTETLDGGFLATGVTRTAHRDLMAWKFDLRGDSVWLQVYIDSLWNEGMYSVQAQPDSSFLISGYTSANGYDMLAIHIDSLGNLLWRRRYGGPGFEAGTMPTMTSDGGSVFATTAGTNGFPNIWVVRVDALGDTLWTRNFVETYPTGGAVPTVMANGNILVMGWIAQGNDYDNYLLCLDPLGNFLWSRRYPGIGFESRTARGVIEDRFGGLSFASSVDLAYGPSGTDHDIALFRLDTLGNVLQIHRVGRHGDEMPRYFEQAADGDYLFFGYSTSFIPQGQQTYLARLHPGGCGEFFYDLSGPNHVTVCPGDSIWVNAGAGFAQYAWSDGDTQQVRLVTQNDTLYVQATDSQGCVHYSSGIVVRSMQGPQYTWTSSGNLTLQLDGHLGNGSQPLWDFGDGMIANVEDTSHTFAQAGTYYVCLQAFVPNCGLESYCDSITVTGTIAVSPSSYMAPRIHPNPSDGRFVLQNSSAEILEISVIDMHGHLVFAGSMREFSVKNLDLTAMAAGVYLLRMSGPEMQLATQRLVIAK
jgi:Secretion system C-terminal sorting domain/PKD domain